MTQLHGLAADNAVGLAALGLSQAFFVNYLHGLDLLLFLVFAAVGMLIFLRKPDNWLTILVSVGIIAQGAGMIRPEDSFAVASPEWRHFAVVLTCLVNICSITCLVLLPDGRFVPAYTRPMTVFWAVCIVVRYVFFPQFARPDGRLLAGAHDPGPWISFLILLLAIGGFITAGIAQVQRYWRLTDATQRQQIKWYVFGVAVAVVGIVLFQLPAIFIPAVRTPGVPRVVFALLGVPAFYFSVMTVPITLAFALLRYRLWEVDTLINRSLVYGALTGALLLVYFVSVAAFQALFQALTGTGIESRRGWVDTGDHRSVPATAPALSNDHRRPLLPAYRELPTGLYRVRTRGAHDHRPAAAAARARRSYGSPARHHARRRVPARQWQQCRARRRHSC